jgi:hypothetical protein
MGQTTEQIETFIEQKRDDLGSDLHELETKVKSLTDWKHYFENSPMTAMGVAFVGGIVLATMLGRGRHRARRGSFSEAPPSSGTTSSTSELKESALEIWHQIKGALMGVAAAKAKDYVNEIIPGFKEEFQRVQMKQ